MQYIILSVSPFFKHTLSVEGKTICKLGIERLSSGGGCAFVRVLGFYKNQPALTGAMSRHAPDLGDSF